MSQHSPNSKIGGFTLIEMLIITPIALLIIAGFIALMITMVGNIMLSHGRNIMTHDIQGSLDRIEQDVKLSTDFLATTGTMPSPQGKDGATAAFSSTSGDLILGEIATDKSPTDPLRSFVYYNTPYGCSDPAQEYKNRIFFTTVIYFVKNGSLWRRTFVPSPSGTLCDSSWQVNTCAPGYAQAATQCKTNDTEVMQNVGSFSVSYYTSANGTLLSAANAPSASTINVQINGQQTVAGRNLTATASVLSTKLSDKDITLAPPGIPAVTAQPYNLAEPNTGTFTWTADPTVTYSVRYNINGGAWVTAAESTKQTSIKLTASRNDTITVQVSARNTTGSSGFGAGASMTIPGWGDCTLQNGWVNYNLGYQPCGYTMTKYGVVVLKGLIQGGTTDNDTVLFQLPPLYRPSYRLIFQVNGATNQAARVDVDTDGTVRLFVGSTTAYVALDGIYFLPNSSLYSWTPLSLQNGWTPYGSPYSPLQATKDAAGRVHIQGLIKQGTFATGTPIAQLPSGSEPADYYHLPARGQDYNVMGITSGGAIVARGISSLYYSTQAMYYPSSFAGWQSFSTVAGDPGDNQIGNGWTSYGSGYPTIAYTKSADGIVTVKGLIKGGNTAKNTLVAKMPAGYWPTKTLEFAATSASGHARFDVTEHGYIQAVVVDSTWTSLSNISFVAEQ
jgi:hypothetical protein